MWSDISVVIPTTPMRRLEGRRLADEVARRCAPGRLTMTEAEAKHDVVSMSSLHHGLGWLLRIEDDAHLGPDFDELPRWLDASYGAVSFFSLRNRPDGIERVAWSSFCMSVCVALRGDLMPICQEFASDWYERTGHCHASDFLIAAWMKHRAARMAVVYPSLVQHRALPSNFAGRSKARQSPTYRMAYGAID